MLINSLNAPAAKSLDAGAENLDDLIRETARGNRDALARLYELTSKSVYSFALSVLKDTHNAEDVLQDCFVQIYSAAGDYSDRGKPMAWILTITRNLCLKFFRSSSKSVPLSDEEWEQIPQGEFEGSVDDRVTLSACMRSLGDDERRIVVLHAISGLKHREIAELLEMPLATVLSKYNRAIKKLKKILEEGAYYDKT